MKKNNISVKHDHWIGGKMCKYKYTIAHKIFISYSKGRTYCRLWKYCILANCWDPIPNSQLYQCIIVRCCIVVTCGDPTPTNGFINVSQSDGSFPVNTAVSFGCNDRHILTGSDSSTCDCQGSWNPQPPNCTPSKNHDNLFIFTTRRRSYVKVIFSQVSVCSRGRWVSLVPEPSMVVGMSRGWAPIPYHGHLVAATIRAIRQAGRTNPTGMLSCYSN